ncbi:MAG: DsrE family protein [Desulfurivibrionaceae bacterium]|nr:DsrE family protein [Desulfurivibrionaceae bacterium]
MKRISGSLLRNPLALFLVFPLAIPTASALAGEYDMALKNVDGVKAVFNVSLGSPAVANAVFWAVGNAYRDEAVRKLPKKPEVAVVFHGKAVKLLTIDKAGFDKKEHGEIDKFQATLREMKKEGVTFEVCMYAVKVIGLDPTTVMPEIDKVGKASSR